MPESDAQGSGPSQEAPTRYLATKEAHHTSFLAETVTGVAGTVVSNLACVPAARLWLRSLDPHDNLQEGHHYHPHQTEGVLRHRQVKATESSSWAWSPQVGPYPTHLLGLRCLTVDMGRRTPGEEGFSTQHPAPPLFSAPTSTHIPGPLTCPCAHTAHALMELTGPQMLHMVASDHSQTTLPHAHLRWLAWSLNG